jgi:hypothetical protein
MILKRAAPQIAEPGLPPGMRILYIEWVKNGLSLEEGCADLRCPEIRIGGYNR